MLLNNVWWLNWQITEIFHWQFTKVCIFSSHHCSLWKLLLLGVKSRLSYKIEWNEQTLPAFYNHSPRSPRSRVFSYPVPLASRECRGKVDKASWENILGWISYDNQCTFLAREKFLMESSLPNLKLKQCCSLDLRRGGLYCLIFANTQMELFFVLAKESHVRPAWYSLNWERDLSLFWR